MKTLRYLLVSFTVMIVMSVSAQSMAEPPRADFHSTSSMVWSGSTLPQAVQEGAYTTYDNGYNPSRANKPGIRRDDNPGGGFNSDDNNNDRDEPWKDPIGDAAWPLLVLAAAFMVRVYLRRRRA